MRLWDVGHKEKEKKKKKRGPLTIPWVLGCPFGMANLFP